MRSGVWPSATLRALLGPRDRENRSLVEISRFSPGPPPGEGEVFHHRPESGYLSLGHPSRGLLLFRSPPGLTGARTGGAAYLCPALWRHLLEAAADAARERVDAGGRPR